MIIYELTQLPLSLFDHKKQIRKLNKAALAKHLKGYVNVTKSPVATKLVIDRGWLLYQCSYYVSGKTYVNIARKYLRLVKILTRVSQ